MPQTPWMAGIALAISGSLIVAGLAVIIYFCVRAQRVAEERRQGVVSFSLHETRLQVPPNLRIRLSEGDRRRFGFSKLSLAQDLADENNLIVTALPPLTNKMHITLTSTEEQREGQAPKSIKVRVPSTTKLPPWAHRPQPLPTISLKLLLSLQTQSLNLDWGTTRACESFVENNPQIQHVCRVGNAQRRAILCVGPALERYDSLVAAGHEDLAQLYFATHTMYESGGLFVAVSSKNTRCEEAIWTTALLRQAGTRLCVVRNSPSLSLHRLHSGFLACSPKSRALLALREQLESWDMRTPEPADLFGVTLNQIAGRWEKKSHLLGPSAYGKEQTRVFVLDLTPGGEVRLPDVNTTIVRGL